MNLEQQFRAALSQEADMQNAPAPDVDRLIMGGQARQRRQRRGRLVRVAVAAVVAVLVAGGVYGIVKIDPGTEAQPAKPPSTTTPQPYRNDPAVSTIDPGRYRMLVGLDVDQVPIGADLTLYDTWQTGNFPVLPDQSGRYGGVAVYQPTGLSAGTGCVSDNKLNTNVAQTPRTLAQQLAHLPKSTLVQTPKTVQKFGYSAVHLQVAITPDCSDVYRVAQTLLGGHGISYGTAKRVLVDFWVMAVGAGDPQVVSGVVPVVVETWHEEGLSSQMLEQIARTRDSIRFVTGG